MLTYFFSNAVDGRATPAPSRIPQAVSCPCNPHGRIKNGPRRNASLDKDNLGYTGWSCLGDGKCNNARASCVNVNTRLRD